MLKAKKDDIRLLCEIMKNTESIIAVMEDLGEKAEDKQLRDYIRRQQLSYLKTSNKIKEKVLEYSIAPYVRTVFENLMEKIEWSIPIIFNLSNEKILETLVLAKTKRQLRLKSALLKFDHASRPVVDMTIELLHMEEKSINDFKKYV